MHVLWIHTLAWWQRLEEASVRCPVSLSYSLEAGSSLNLVPGCLPANPDNTEVRGMCGHSWLFTWMLKIWTRVLTLAQYAVLPDEPSTHPLEQPILKRLTPVRDALMASQCPYQHPGSNSQLCHKGSGISAWDLEETDDTPSQCWEDWESIGKIGVVQRYSLFHSLGKHVFSLMTHSVLYIQKEWSW